MAIDVVDNSMLRFSENLDVDDVEFFDLVEVDIPVQPGDLFYSVRSGDRIDTVAFRFYGDSTLWWVIAVANDMELLPFDFNAGSTIRIPSPDYVSSTLFKRSKG